MNQFNLSINRLVRSWKLYRHMQPIAGGSRANRKIMSTDANRRLHSERTHQAVATMFNSANFLPTEAEQHQTLRTPSIAKSCSADKRSARRLRFASVLISLLPI